MSVARTELDRCRCRYPSQPEDIDDSHTFPELPCRPASAVRRDRDQPRSARRRRRALDCHLGDGAAADRDERARRTGRSHQCPAGALSGWRGAWSDAEIAKVVGWLVKSIATVTPAAMLGSTAPFPDPGEVVVEVTAGQPINAMGAFERPVTPTLEASLAAFEQHMQRVWAMIGQPAKVMRLSEFIDPSVTSPAVQRLADAVAAALPTVVPAKAPV